MSVQTIQTSFIAGEISPALFGRQDDPLLGLGAEDLTNFIVRKTGTLLKRSGLEFVYDFGDAECRLEEFRFASNQTLVLIFAPNKLYFATKQGLVLNGDTPYSIDTPYAKADLWDLSFSQNADVVTITSVKHPPRELRRYGATDWRIVDLTTRPDIVAPSNLRGTATYPKFTPVDNDDKDPNAGTYDIIKAQYKVTAVDNDGAESEPSAAIVVNCNYYITGATVELSWSAVSGASYYRVYRAVSGIFGFLGQTEVTNLSDTGSTPDTAKTPPKYKSPFSSDDAKRIVSIDVIDGGDGYYENSSITVKGNLNLSSLPALSVVERNASTGGTAGPTIDPNAGNVTPSVTKMNVKVIFRRRDGTDIGHVLVPYEFVSARSFTSTSSNIQNDKPVHTKSNVAHCVFAPVKSIINPSGVVSVTASGLGTLPSDCIVRVEPEHIPQPRPRTSISWQMQDWNTVSGGTGWALVGYPSHCLNLAARFGRDSLNNGWVGKFEKYPAHVIGGYLEWWVYECPYKILRSTSGGGALGESTQTVIPLSISDSTGTGASAQAIAIDGVIKSVNVMSSGRNYTNPTVTAGGTGSGARFSVRLSEASDVEYPTCSGQYDQRRVFAGSLKNPLKLWMTNAGSQNLMTVHTPLQDDDRIEVVALSSDADIIRHIVAMDSLILFTGSSELRVFSQSGVMSPRTIGVRAQSYVGANGVTPVVAKNTIVYISARGAHPQALNYTETSGLYMSQDLGVRCSHLFDGLDIVDLALCKTPEQLLLAVSTNGDLLVCNYLPEQQVNAWSKIRTDGQVTSVSSVAEGVEDRVYVMVKRYIGGKYHYYLECLAPMLYQEDEEARCLDCFSEATFSDPVSDITGLGYLEGKHVIVVGDQKAQGPYLVENGAVKLDEPAQHVIVGIPYQSDVVTVPLDHKSPETIMAPRVVADDIRLRVSYDGNLKCSRYPILSDNDLYPCKRDTVLEKEQNERSVILSARVSGRWGHQCQLLIRNDDHLPLEISAMLVNLGYAGK